MPLFRDKEYLKTGILTEFTLSFNINSLRESVVEGFEVQTPRLVITLLSLPKYYCKRERIIIKRN